MDKYQEALDLLAIQTDKEIIYQDEINHYVNTLQELIDKATPIKPIKDEPSRIRYVQTYKCPKCGGGFSGTISKYCYHCGQALDCGSE